MKIVITAYLNPLQFCSFVLSLLYFSPVLLSMFPHFFKQLFFIASRVYRTNSSTLPSAGRGLTQPKFWPPASWRVQQSWSSRHRPCLIWQEESNTTSLSGRTEKTGKNFNLHWLANQFPKVTGKVQEGKSPSSLLFQPISSSSLLFEAISPSCKDNKNYAGSRYRVF